MHPTVGRVAFNIAVLLVVMALMPLPWLRRDSAEFVVDVLALGLSLVFLLLVAWEVRREVKKELEVPARAR